MTQTRIDPEEYAYNSYSGAPTTSNRRGRLLCEDGKVRTFRLGIPDTFFSIPAVGRINGRYVRGFASVRDDYETPVVYTFTETSTRETR